MLRRIGTFIVVAIALLATACGSDSQSLSTPPSRSAVTTTSMSTTTVPAITSTTAVPTTTTSTIQTTTTTAPTPITTLEQVRAKLIELRYYDPATDDGDSAGLADAILAFEKVEGLPRTAMATPDVMLRLTTASEPASLVPNGNAYRVEIDLTRQVLFLYENGQLTRIVHVSTGVGQAYCLSSGECFDGYTPSGWFTVTEKYRGPLDDELGRVYNPLFFGPPGVSIHGLEDVPWAPGSHGCVRVPMHVSEWLFEHIRVGTAVYVV